ncbi:alpha/beta hydrolase [Candidatus Wolfebacteria bacterium]|nr:alpha/beta hydrolase [Candidatus Wolfebacteria bacterium]
MNKSIVILHGWGGGVNSFEKTTAFLKDKGISVFIFDLPGFRSEPAPQSPWSVDDYVNFASQKIQSFGLDKFYLFGHSFGGRISIKFAEKYPEKLIGLILCDAAGVTPRPKIKIAVFGFLSKIGNGIFKVSFLKPLQKLVRKFVYFLSGERDYYYLQNGVMRETFKKVINEDLTFYLNKIKTPTLIIWGKNDKMTPVADAYVINKNIAGSRLEILKDVGHSPHLQSPEKLGEIVADFLQKF